MTWWGAMAWADWLDYGGYNDWRLTTITDLGGDGCNFAYSGTDCGYNVDTGTGELAYMHHDILGNESWYNSDGTQNTTGCQVADPFCMQNTSADGVDILNLQSFVYWSGTEYAPSPDLAWYFYSGFGYQHRNAKLNQDYGWAVRSGQVAAAPLPPTSLLMALGLIGLGVRRYARRATLALREGRGRFFALSVSTRSARICAIKAAASSGRSSGPTPSATRRRCCWPCGRSSTSCSC